MTLIATQFSGGQISLNTFLIKWVPQLSPSKQQVASPTPQENTSSLVREGSSGNGLECLKDQTLPSLPPWTTKNPLGLTQLLLSSPEVVLGNFPLLETSHPWSFLFTFPSIRGRKARQVIISLRKSRCLLKDLATRIQMRSFSSLLNELYYLCLIIKCQNMETFYLHDFNAKNQARICHKPKKFGAGHISVWHVKSG